MLPIKKADMPNKKAVLDLATSWVEIVFITLLLIGIILSVFAGNVLFNYIIILLSGLMFGRLLYQERMNFKFSFYLIVFGFLLGYIVGSYYANRKTVLLLFLIGVTASYYIHLKKWLS